MFKDTKEGKTHSYNDGCGEPAHNPKLPQHIEEKFDKEFPLIRETGIEEAEGVFFNKDDSDRVKSFIATILEEERKKIIDIINKYDDTRHNQEAKETIRDIINLIKEDK